MQGWDLPEILADTPCLLILASSHNSSSRPMLVISPWGGPGLGGHSEKPQSGLKPLLLWGLMAKVFNTRDNTSKKISNSFFPTGLDLPLFKNS